MRGMSIALLVIGIVLLVLALYSGDSVSSGFARIFKGTPDNKTIGLLIGGLFATILGLVGVFRPARA